MRNKLSSGSFIFIIFLAIMAYNSFASGRFSDPRAWLIETLFRLPAIVIGITLHEFAHAFSAYKLGDQTPKAQGRVTVSPLAHIDPIGIVALIFVGFGWGRPVQVNPFAFRKNRRLSNLLVDVAGVVTNFIIAFICAGLLFFIHNDTLSTLVYYIVYINLVLMIFNLLPIPPLDGFGIITEIFDFRRYSWYQPLYNNGFFILLLILVVPRFFGFDLLGRLLWPSLDFLLKFLANAWIMILY